MKEKIRVSCSNLVRIDLDDRIVLTPNLDKKGKGIFVYTPVGGVLTVTDKGLEFLKKKLGCEFRLDNGNLRLMMNRDYLPEFEKWFYGYQDRELSPLRELEEELVDEENIFEALPESEIEILEKISNVEERKITDKSGDEGLLTQRYFEVWALRFSEAYNQIIRKNIMNQGSAYAATKEEICALKTKDGKEIRDNCLVLTLDPLITPYRKINVGEGTIKLYLNQ